MENNYHYSQKVMEFAQSHSIPMVYASSAATYGNGEFGYVDDPQLTKIERLIPVNAYGYSKQLFDVWASKRYSHAKTPWLGLKFFNVFGPGEYHKEGMMSLVAKAVPQIQQTGALKLFKSHRSGYEDGEQRRDFVYVKDIVHSMANLYERFNSGKFDAPNGVYNMGTGEAHSFFELAQEVFRALDHKVNVQWIDMPESIRNQYQYFTEADMTRSQEYLRYENRYSFSAAIKDYVQNYLLHSDQYL